VTKPAPALYGPDQTVARAVVGQAGDSRPIVLTIYSGDAEVDMALSPVRALELAKELIEPAVMAIKVSQWGPGWSG